MLVSVTVSRPNLSAEPGRSPSRSSLDSRLRNDTESNFALKAAKRSLRSSATEAKGALRASSAATPSSISACEKASLCYDLCLSLVFVPGMSS